MWNKSYKLVNQPISENTKKTTTESSNLKFEIRKFLWLTSLSEQERKPVVYCAGLLMAVRGVNRDTTGGLLAHEGPTGVQLP